MAKRILTLCLALVIGIAFAMPAVAAVKSIKVGGDLTIRGIYRQNLDFITNAPEGNSWLMSTTRVLVGAELTDNVSVVVRLLNERDWDTEGVASTDIDLDLAYLKLKDLLVPGLSATLGRQEILLGKGFVVGNVKGITGGTLGNLGAKDLTARKAFDALRLDYEVGTLPLTVTLFDAKIVETGTDLDLIGLNVAYKMDNLTAEVYALLLDEASGANRTTYTYGARVDQNVSAVPGLNYNLEAAMQDGLVNDDWAGNADVSYTFQNPMQLKVGAAWYNAVDGTYNPLYPNNLGDRIGRLVYASALQGTLDQNDIAIAAGQNMSVPKVYASLKPSEKLTISLALFPATTINDDLDGFGFDSGITYQYTEDVSFGFLVDYVSFSDMPNDDAWQAIGTVAVSF